VSFRRLISILGKQYRPHAFLLCKTDERKKEGRERERGRKK
jgi:hypothetical protein